MISMAYSTTRSRGATKGDETMRKVILQEFVTLNGLAAGPNDSVDFVPESTTGDQSFGDRQMAFMDSIDTILLGRTTYQMFSQYWPEVKEGGDKPFADKLNAISKIVFSRTLDRAPWGAFDDAVIVGNDAAKEVARLKQESGKAMVIWGSLSLARSLIEAGLIDDYQLVVCPVVLERGKPLFPDDAQGLDLRLIDTRSFDRGAVLLAYVPAR
ncbi:MAG: reductase [Gemmatimonas sp.]|nr:reductase [Gemmatimonas sp.]